MDYFPIFVAVKAQKILFVGGGMDIVHKVRLALKTTAEIHFFSHDLVDDLEAWGKKGRITIHRRAVTDADCADAVFAFIDGDDAAMRDHAIGVFDENHLLYAVIDDQARSRFITPALVDRDPVVVAIGTEGTGPIIARDIKAKIEQILDPALGIVAKTAGKFRPKAASLPKGVVRRRFWMRFLNDIVPPILAKKPEHLEQDLTQGLTRLLSESMANDGEALPYHQQHLNQHAITTLMVASPDADHLTRGALKLIHDADVVIHDGGISHDILELTRRESIRVAASTKTPRDLAELAAKHQRQGETVVILKDAHQHHLKAVS